MSALVLAAHRSRHALQRVVDLARRAGAGSRPSSAPGEWAAAGARPSIPGVVSLDQGGLWCIHGVPGLCVEVGGGRIWLTEEGRGEDLFLGPGMQHVVQGAGRVVVEADVPGQSWLRITRPDEPRPARARS